MYVLVKSIDIIIDINNNNNDNDKIDSPTLFLLNLKSNCTV